MEKIYQQNKVLIKAGGLCLVTFLCAFLLMMLFSPLVDAATLDVVTPTITEITLVDLLALLIGNEQAAALISALGLLCFILTHVRAWIPATWLAKCPAWLISGIDKIAGNYNGAKNESISSTNRNL